MTSEIGSSVGKAHRRPKAIANWSYTHAGNPRQLSFACRGRSPIRHRRGTLRRHQPAEERELL